MNDNPTNGLPPKAPFPDGGPAGVASAASVTVCGATDVGCVRPHNEDGFTILDGSSGVAVGPGEVKMLPLAGRGVLMMVCDGMGGHAAGEVASRLAGEVVARVVEEMGDTAGSSPAEVLRAALKRANHAIFEESRRRDEKRGMGTTCTAALLFANRMVLAEVGDSRAYLWRAGALKQLTRDQSLVAAMLDSGALTPEEAKKFPHPNIILQALGVQDDVEPVISEIEPAPGDVILLSSDGLHGPVPGEQIVAILREATSLATCAQALIGAALAAGGPDNVTVILARYEGVSQSGV